VIAGGAACTELSIAISMIDAVLEEREEHGGGVQAIHVRLRSPRHPELLTAESRPIKAEDI
jgi:hypothetical protein